jgi:hypothetical protein
MTLIIEGKRPARGYEQGVSILKKAKWMYREYMDYYRRFGGQRPWLNLKTFLFEIR